MPKSRRRSHKRLKTVPIQNCQIQTTPIRAISSPPELLLVRRSQRLREKTKPAATVVSDFERDVLRRLHRRAFNVAAAVDSICGSSSSGNNMNNNSNENKRQSQINNNNSGINRNLLPCDAWVYRTPEKQRLPRPGRPLPTKQVPMGLARIHTIRRRMLEGGCVIEEAEDTVVISPIVDDVAGGGGDNFFTGVSCLNTFVCCHWLQTNKFVLRFESIVQLDLHGCCVVFRS